ncbi:MAG TPA: methyltransferase domain-containing protein [Streptosporangiaceae bacterium]|nr:methyltransferase domain-containing protein [Streptosporangiaceae bacterium]
MALRPSNRQRNRWAVALLDVGPTDRVLEIGFGPGIAIREAARRASRGRVAGIDHSPEMVRQASRRNAAAVREGRVELHQAAVDGLPSFESAFDKVLVVNSLGLWPHPVDHLIEIRSLMRRGGIIAVVSQPRCPGAGSEHTDRTEREIRQQLQHAGFGDIRSERLDLNPPVTCVLATRPADPGEIRSQRRLARAGVAPAAPDGLTRQAQQTWEAVAPAWERHRDKIFDATMTISDRLVELVDPRPGKTILELTAGTGETGYLVAGQLGADGLLISTDFSDAMVQAAERGAAERGLDNVECRVMDAQAIDLPGESVDGVLSRFGLMLVADPLRTLEESRRVLRPGGRLAYAVWGTIDRNPWITLIGGALLQMGHAPDDPFGPGGMFSLSEPEHNMHLATEAGFAELEAEQISGAMQADSLQDYWSFQTSISGPVATLLATLSADERDAVRVAFHAAAKPYRTGDGYRLPYCAVIFHASR